MHFKENSEYDVVAFTVAQIPGIAGRKYPPKLAGSNYPHGIPIYDEEELPNLMAKYDVDEVVFAYSDVSHEHVMHNASLALACGSDFRLMGLKSTMLKSRKPVIAVCAVRTGAGKSPVTRKVCEILKKRGRRVVAIRHPMPYCDFEKELCQRLASYEDLEGFGCTIEEREEFEPLIERGIVVYDGIDYKMVLREAEKEAEVIVWDGGNNDFPFFEPTLHIVVADAHRPGHELTYYPGETNLLMADVVVINKIDTAPKENLETIMKNIKAKNSRAQIVKATSPITVDHPDLIKGRNVLVVEDGPTLTHGGMIYGAGTIAAEKFGGRLVDPRRFAVGSISEVYRKYTHLGSLLPAVGYSGDQIRELEETINAVDCDAVVIGTPIDLRRIIRVNKPMVRVKYEIEEIGKPDLEEILGKSKF